MDGELLQLHICMPRVKKTEVKGGELLQLHVCMPRVKKTEVKGGELLQLHICMPSCGNKVIGKCMMQLLTYLFL